MPRYGRHFFNGKTIELFRAIKTEISPAPFRPFTPEGHKVRFTLPDGTLILEQHYETASAAQSGIFTINHLIEHLESLSLEAGEQAIENAKQQRRASLFGRSEQPVTTQERES